MATDGRNLEALVAYVEQQFLPQGFNVENRVRRYGADGIQIAEFDIVVFGKVGTTEFEWLIECRDRPAEGPAPGSWIEQLVGRRTAHGFHKVTAVSTTGFSSGARSIAATSAIELREVGDLEPEAFRLWMQMTSVTVTNRIAKATGAYFAANEADSAALRDLLDKMTETGPIQNKDRILRKSSDGSFVSIDEAFLGALQHTSEYTELPAAERPYRIRADVSYSNDSDHFQLQGLTRLIRVRSISFLGEVQVQQHEAPLLSALRYDDHTGQMISEFVSFAPMALGENLYSLEFHRIPGLDQTQIALRHACSILPKPPVPSSW